MLRVSSSSLMLRVSFNAVLTTPSPPAFFCHISVQYSRLREQPFGLAGGSP